MKRVFFSVLLAAILSMSLLTAAAATTETVTQNTTTWAEDDTRAGGDVQWSSAYGAPADLGTSALVLTTGASNNDKAGLYTHTMTGTALAGVSNLAYQTYQHSASSSVGAASFQLQVETGCGFTTLVYEPYWNGAVVNGQWQSWNVDEGQFWSSKNVNCGSGNLLVAGAGGPPFYTLADVNALFPNAIVTGIGLNVGTYNPSYVVATDGVEFNDTTYNFEIGTRPTTKDECKKDGWMTFNDPSFKNQGACVSYVAKMQGQ